MENICKIKAQNLFLIRNLKFLRECCGVTQQQIANALCVDRSTYTLLGAWQNNPLNT